MGEVIPFGKRPKKVQKNLDIEMVFNEIGFGIHPRMIRAVHITKGHNVYFVFYSHEALGFDYDMPTCGIQCVDEDEAIHMVKDLKEQLKYYYDKDIEVFYDKGGN